MSVGIEAVLAVVVLFNRKIEDVPSINKLASWMTMEQPPSSCFQLMYCLVYDNSPVEQDRGKYKNCKLFNFFHDSSNGGTRAAYLKALQLAQQMGYQWILFLDHDTDLPADLFQAADRALAESSQVNSVCAVVPLIFDGSSPISPIITSPYGRGRPMTDKLRRTHAGTTMTAISSAALVRVDSLVSVLPIPASFSLDYLDHWLFRAMQNRGENIVISNALVAHSLSVQSMRSISVKRYRSILSAEFLFLRGGTSEYSILLHALRLMLRAVKLMLTTQRLDLPGACIVAAFNIFRAR